MYVCICICIHVNVCHVYIVCHAYIYTCVYLVRVDLDIILLVVSDGHDSAKGWKSLFENVGVFEVHELCEFFIPFEHRGLVHLIVTKISVSMAQLLTFECARRSSPKVTPQWTPCRL